MKKGNAWHFGYKAHVGVDQDTGLVHTLEVTTANVHDVTMTSKLLNERIPLQKTATANRFTTSSIVARRRSERIPPDRKHS